MDPEKQFSCNLKTSSFLHPWNAIWQTGSSFLDHKNKADGGFMKHVYFGGFQFHKFRGLRSCPWNLRNAVLPQYISEPSPRGSRLLENNVLSFKNVLCVRFCESTGNMVLSLALHLVHVLRGLCVPSPLEINIHTLEMPTKARMQGALLRPSVNLLKKHSVSPSSCADGTTKSN